MSDLIPGKRYRVTVEGVANEVGALADGVPRLLGGDRHGRVVIGSDVVGRAIVEQLPDPLPATSGSVVRKDDMTYLRMDPDYGMPWVDSANECWDDAHLVGATILFDAGADQ